MHERHSIWPKLGDAEQVGIFDALLRQRPLESSGMLGKGAVLYYKNTGLRYFNTVTLARHFAGSMELQSQAHARHYSGWCHASGTPCTAY